MTILSTDVKMFQSERLTDNPDGGGRMTGNEIIDGEVNNLFPDISRLDRVYGRVNLREWFLAIDTANTDSYYGAHSIVDESPDDPNVHTVLFATGSDPAVRSEARDHIESYVTAGPESQMRPLGDQLAGQRSITAWQREEAKLPEIGEVYLLSIEDDGHPENGQQQYVRVQDVSHEVQTFTQQTSSGFVDFDARAVTLSLTTALRDDFPGKSPTRDFSTGVTLIRQTQVANSANYYGIQPVTVPLANGDTQITVADVYTPLVPATQAETPQTDIDAGASVEHEEESNGETVDVSDFAETAETAVTIQNRALTWVKNLLPLPAPGTLVVEFRALGNWNRLTDRGDGKLEGDGTGTVDYATGSVSVTLGAMPDVGTAVIYTWGTPFHYTDRGGSVEGIDVPVAQIRPDKDMKPGSLTIEWENPDTTLASASDDGAGGLTGDATGRVIYSGPERKIDLEPDTLPDPATQYALDYETATLKSESVTVDGGENDPSFTIPNTPIVAGTVAIRCPVIRRTDASDFSFYLDGEQEESDAERTVEITDDANGTLVMRGENVGTIDYSTGDVAFDPTVDYTREAYTGSVAGQTFYTSEILHETMPANALVLVDYADGSAAWGAQSESTSAPPVRMNLTRTTQETIMAGTVKFDFAGGQFVDRKGRLYRDVSEDGSGILAGSINYSSGAVQIDDYPGGNPVLTVRTMITRPADWNVTSLAFRTPGSPVKPLSFYLQVSDAAGNLIEATADANGNLDAPAMDGKIDTETGVVRVDFGQMVADADLTSEQKNEPWYDPDDVDENGDIWVPRQVLPSTASFNAVILSSLPLDADLLGLDPVRLPGDGRVPIYQEAGVVVVHHTETEPMPSPLSAGQTVTMPRADLAMLWLVDDTGAKVDVGQYSVDLEAGSVTMADPLDLSGYTEPLAAHHRIEDMLLVTDVQIDGRLTVAAGVTRDYPADTTYCSSAVIHGDMQARVTDFFTQASWDGSTWSDTRQGDDTTASYNTTQYPVEVENQGAIKERWALEFTSSTAFNIVGESVGVIGTGDTSSTTAPTNPATGAPYFSMQPDGWGSGWQVGNVVRFNTQAATAPVWTARTILAGEATGANDSFRIQNRGDAD